jgi:ribonuclease R
VEELLLLQDLAHTIRREREKTGAINFDQDEVKFKLDERGRPIAVYKKERLDTNLLIEDFMLLANREIAEFIYNLGKKRGVRERAFIYRIHDTPKEDRLEELEIFLRAIGYELRSSKGAVAAHDINRLFKEIEGKPEEDLIKVATIRSMAKAVYSTKNIGHFGLAFKYYTHFTSPIRRYPDMMVHRILRHHLGGLSAASAAQAGTRIPEHEFDQYEKLSIACSEREVEAAEAERDSIKYKQVEYMKERVGQIFDGVVSGVTEWGLYVEEVETKAEGLIRISKLGGDYFALDQKNYRIVGERTKKKFSLGDKVRVKLTAADLDTRTIDWELM